MTKEEIKDLIAAKIAGQGSAVDVGGALPVILNEILNAIPQTPTVRPAYLEAELVDFENKTASQAAGILGISLDQFEALTRGEYPVVIDTIHHRSFSVLMLDGANVYFITGDSSGVSAFSHLYYYQDAWSLNEI